MRVDELLSRLHSDEPIEVIVEDLKRPKETQLELPLVWPELDLDGYVDEAKNVRYIGKARMRPNGKWMCLAAVGNFLCIVEVAIHFGATA